jgi:hypothetical protein
MLVVRREPHGAHKIWTVFSSYSFSCFVFEGVTPETLKGSDDVCCVDVFPKQRNERIKRRGHDGGDRMSTQEQAGLGDLRPDSHL